MISLTDCGVITGTDQNHQGLLPWWFSTFRKSNPTIPVAFFNFGNMSNKCIDWCKANGQYIDLSEIKTKYGWFKKPAAIWYSPFKKTLWVDNDCEIRKSIDGIFSFSVKDRIGLTYDPMNTFCTNYKNRVIKKPVATGVVLAEPKNELIKDWAAHCIAAKNIRGDQEVLNYLLSIREKHQQFSTKITILPDEYQWLRIYNRENPDAIIFHWTGPEGKAHIHKCIKENGIENFSG